ncbi:MAG: hypothetical protein Alpg2KO_04390 [Alphaproteobacteria bacterium]
MKRVKAEADVAVKKLVCTAIMAGLISALGGALSPAQAEGESGVRLRYDIYVGGVHLLDGRIDMAQDAKTYTGVLKLEGRGLASLFGKWEMEARTAGLVPDSAPLRPLAYRMRRDGKERWRIREFDWAADGTMTRQRSAKKYGDKSLIRLPAEHVKGSIDTVTAFAQMMHQMAQTGSCDAVLPLYDGKRRFDITMSKGETVPLKLSGYKGDSLQCKSRFKPVAGFEGDDDGGGIWGSLSDPKAEALPMWMAKPDGLPHPVPVKFQMETERGLINAVLRSSDKLDPKRAAALLKSAPKPLPAPKAEE